MTRDEFGNDVMSDAEIWDRGEAGIAHDFGPPPPRQVKPYTSEQLQADVFKLGCDLNRVAAGKIGAKREGA